MPKNTASYYTSVCTKWETVQNLGNIASYYLYTFSQKIDDKQLWKAGSTYNAKIQKNYIRKISKSLVSDV